MTDWYLYVWLGSSESIYRIVSAEVRLIVLTGLSSFNNSTSAGRLIFVVVNLIHASVQLTSSKVKFILGCSSGGMGLSFSQDNKKNEENNNVVTNKIIFI